VSCVRARVHDTITTMAHVCAISVDDELALMHKANFIHRIPDGKERNADVSQVPPEVTT